MAENIIYCYSGSGHCLNMAKDIAKALGDTDIVMLRKFPVKTDATEAKRVGFVFSCMAGGLPGDMEAYLRHIKIAPDAYVFAVEQFAGYLGCGLHKIDQIFPLDYWTGISHQSACIWLMPHTLMFPPLTPEKAQKRTSVTAGARRIITMSVSPRPPAMFFAISRQLPVPEKQKMTFLLIVFSPSLFFFTGSDRRSNRRCRSSPARRSCGNPSAWSG